MRGYTLDVMNDFDSELDCLSLGTLCGCPTANLRVGPYRGEDPGDPPRGAPLTSAPLSPRRPVLRLVSATDAPQARAPAMVWATSIPTREPPRDAETLGGIVGARIPAGPPRLAPVTQTDQRRAGRRPGQARIRDWHDLPAASAAAPVLIRLRRSHAEGPRRDLVAVRDIRFLSICGRRRRPVLGRAHIAYRPNGDRVAGPTRLKQLITLLAQQPQPLELIAGRIAAAVIRQLRAAGVAVVCEAHALSPNGPREDSPPAPATSLAFGGVFRVDSPEREQALALLGFRTPQRPADAVCITAPAHRDWGRGLGGTGECSQPTRHASDAVERSDGGSDSARPLCLKVHTWCEERSAPNRPAKPSGERRTHSVALKEASCRDERSRRPLHAQEHKFVRWSEVVTAKET